MEAPIILSIFLKILNWSQIFSIVPGAKYGVSGATPLRINNAAPVHVSFGTYPSLVWSPEPRYIHRGQAAPLGALMSRAWSVVPPQVRPFGRWRKLKSGASRRRCRDFNVCSSSQRMETVLPRSVTTLCADSVNHCTNVGLSLLTIRAQNAPSLVGVDHR
jgi:hypothetical protein